MPTSDSDRAHPDAIAAYRRVRQPPGQREPRAVKRPARITISTDPRSVTVDPAGSPSEPPSPPEDIRITIYSPTAAELFWTRAPQRERVRSTEVRRDGELIATVPGNSFYDDTRECGTAYVYELTAIDADGLRSEPSVFVRRGNSITTTPAAAPLARKAGRADPARVTRRPVTVAGCRVPVRELDASSAPALADTPSDTAPTHATEIENGRSTGSAGARAWTAERKTLRRTHRVLVDFGADVAEVENVEGGDRPRC